MFVAHKSNQILSIDDKEWDCRRKAKGIKTFAEYRTWEKSITDSDGVKTYPSEDFTIVHVLDENERRIDDLISYISFDIDFPSYNIKWQDDKGNAEEILDSIGNSHDPKQYVQSHFVPDDTAKNKRILDQEWTRIREERDKLLTESDWTQANDTPLSDANVAKWKTYRTSLRDLPSDQSSKTKYSDITWPTKP